jgi:hypothetical protein
MDDEISHARAYPVSCARKDDLGCTASFPGSRWGAIKAGEEGWFSSRRENKVYCPDHVPDWVPAWREKQPRKAQRRAEEATRD